MKLGAACLSTPTVDLSHVMNVHMLTTTLLTIVAFGFAALFKTSEISAEMISTRRGTALALFAVVRGSVDQEDL